jgi:hypothetical protein
MRLGVILHKVRGFRMLDLAAMVVLMALALGVYAFKTSAGAEREDIADVESQIHDETRQVRLLQDQVDRLESPDALERDARADGVLPIDAKHEISVDALPTLQAQARIAPAPPAASSAAISNAVVAAPAQPAAPPPQGAAQ